MSYVANVDNFQFLDLHQSPAAYCAKASLRVTEQRVSYLEVVATEREQSFLADLARIAKEASLPDWDGPGTVALRVDAIERAHTLSRLLPVSLPHPDMSCTPAGSLALDWMAGPKLQLSVVLSRSNRIGYAAYFSDGRTHGEHDFSPARLPDELSAAIAKWTKRVAGIWPRRAA